MGLVWSPGLAHCVIGDPSLMMVMKPAVRAVQRTNRRKIICMIEVESSGLLRLLWKVQGKQSRCSLYTEKGGELRRHRYVEREKGQKLYA
jgi:hypothetical protein